MSATDTSALSEEFIVSRDKVDLIDKLKGKIERLFGTRVYFKETSRDGDKEKRWIEVTGGKWDRQNAKTYIIGLCDPQETKILSCTSDVLDDVIEDIERNTQAVISRQGSRQVQISGSELSVTLALSTLEDLTNESFQPTDDGQASRERTASHRLDEGLKQAFGEESGSLQNYSDSIKRVLLEYHEHSGEIEDLLHGSGCYAPTRKSSSEVIFRSKDETDTRKNVTVPIYHVNSREETTPSQEMVVTDGAPKKVQLEEVFSEKFTEAAQISPRSKQLSMNGHGSGPVALKRFAKNVGYSNDEIDEGLLYVKPPIMPNDFLDILKKIKEEKKRLGLENDQMRDDEVITIDSDESDCSELSMGENHADTKIDGFGISAIQKKMNDRHQEELAKEFKCHSVKKVSKKKKKSPTGTKRKSNPESDHEQTCVLKLWESTDAPSEKTTENVSREQRLVGPVPEIPQAPKPLIPHLPTPQVCPQPFQQTFPRQPMVQQTQATIHPSNPSSPRGMFIPGPTVPTVYGLPGFQTPRARPTIPQQQVAGTPPKSPDLRYVIIDGSNVAMFHGNNKVFSCRGIQIAVDYFVQRGHRVTVFVPEWRKYKDYNVNRIRDQEILYKLEDEECLVFTPSRKIQGKLVCSYDDRYILGLAEKEDSVILSNDQYRDLMKEKASWKKIVEERLLMYRFVGDHFMPTEDPLGRNGPMLEEFLRKSLPPPPHPTHYIPAASQRNKDSVPQGFQGQGQQRPNPWKAPRLPIITNSRGPEILNRLPPPRRHDHVTKELFSQLLLVFPEPEQAAKVKQILDRYSSETDLNRLTNYCMEIMF